jgi:hypothetical protein
VDPRELTWSYEFGVSLVTVGHIRQMDSLGYFAEGLMHEPGEEILSEPNSNKAVVFMSFSPWDCGCRLVVCLPRFCLSFGCSYIN